VLVLHITFQQWLVCSTFLCGTLSFLPKTPGPSCRMVGLANQVKQFVEWACGTWKAYRSCCVWEMQGAWRQRHVTRCRVAGAWERVVKWQCTVDTLTDAWQHVCPSTSVFSANLDLSASILSTSAVTKMIGRAWLCDRGQIKVRGGVGVGIH
jgi:hypothetical protein